MTETARDQLVSPRALQPVAPAPPGKQPVSAGALPKDDDSGDNLEARMDTLFKAFFNNPKTAIAACEAEAVDPKSLLLTSIDSVIDSAPPNSTVEQNLVRFNVKERHRQQLFRRLLLARREGIRPFLWKPTPAPPSTSSKKPSGFNNTFGGTVSSDTVKMAASSHSTAAQQQQADDPNLFKLQAMPRPVQPSHVREVEYLQEEMQALQNAVTNLAMYAERVTEIESATEHLPSRVAITHGPPLISVYSPQHASAPRDRNTVGAPQPVILGPRAPGHRQAAHTARKRDVEVAIRCTMQNISTHIVTAQKGARYDQEAEEMRTQLRSAQLGSRMANTNMGMNMFRDESTTSQHAVAERQVQQRIERLQRDREEMQQRLLDKQRLDEQRANEAISKRRQKTNVIAEERRLQQILAAERRTIHKKQMERRRHRLESDLTERMQRGDEENQRRREAARRGRLENDHLGDLRTQLRNIQRKVVMEKRGDVPSEIRKVLASIPEDLFSLVPGAGGDQ